MSNTTNFKNLAPKGLRIIEQTDSLYHYARVISNTRFGYQPVSVAYCKDASHVQYCVKFCSQNNKAFRIRSGGHQHEGMCSGNGVIIIDLSEMNKIEYIDNQPNQAWIPVGKQLDSVYTELEKEKQIIPGGGCQSVNVGGLTQGGGWGYSIRKFGMTCDSILAAEIVLANGTIEIVSEENQPELFWALKGGGGGNFGVVTRFKFQLSALTDYVTTFGLTWKHPEDVKEVIRVWMNLHASTEVELDPALSSSCTMILANPDEKDLDCDGIRELEEGQKSFVDGRMGGQFYGTKTDLIKLLKKCFGEDLIPEDSKFTLLKEVCYASKKKSLAKSEKETHASLARHQSILANFLNPTSTPEQEIRATNECKHRNYRVLPVAPTSTCDQPHPHKVSSSFPKKYTCDDNSEMTERIYDFLSKCCYYGDVSKYMSFHCLGGAVKKNVDKRVFAFSDKPYLLQIQGWWDDISNAFDNQSRNDEYVKWVKDFRLNIAPFTEGSFINFVDQSLVDHPETHEGLLELLEIYYGENNLSRLRKIKAEQDPNELFKFKMSIPPLIE
ncbi:FAD-dependent oxidoreductase [Flavivirga jejuensis]|uniref:FAD-binding protein n=1 Tax=Flavivirga jejuensis TaxID=870487 RepID=A0ABT8WPA5_9FLAO|nr:FAD-dependent oxidoreductase [Flavivirga jejuensis]MDO5974963.1 FAD-binding protein [Flavivirga jejuensis]